MDPYYTRAGVTLYHGSALDHTDAWTSATALITDPPYGISYKPVRVGERTPAPVIANDKTTAVCDEALAAWHDPNALSKPVAVFGSWKAPRPPQTKYRLI